ncbi:MAG: hypothetical protein ACM359_25000 [Bacillota bacterium]
MDEALLLKPIAEELKSVPPIPHFTAGESVPTTGEPTISGPVPASNRAELMQKTGCSTGHLEAHQGNAEVSSTVSGEQQEGEAQITQLAQDGANEQGPTPDGIGPSQERVMGLEPTTFTLARSKLTNASAAIKGLTFSIKRDCTSDCTSNTKTISRQCQGDGTATDFTEALAMIVRLPLSESEKAEALRQLLAQKIRRRP